MSEFGLGRVNGDLPFQESCSRLIPVAVRGPCPDYGGACFPHLPI